MHSNSPGAVAIGVLGKALCRREIGLEPQLELLQFWQDFVLKFRLKWQYSASRWCESLRAIVFFVLSSPFSLLF